MEACGGVNVLADTAADFTIISRETALVTDAELVLHGIAEDFDDAAVEALFGKRIKTAYVNPDLIQRPSLRLAEGVANVCRLIGARRAGAAGRAPFADTRVTPASQKTVR